MVNSIVRLTLAAAVLAGPVACGSDESPPPSAVARDSAGVRIVESLTETSVPVPWDLASEPHWVVGDLDGDEPYLLSQVEGAMEVAGGEVVVANRGTNELRFYDEMGQWTRTLGGTGQGPGEFEYLRALAPCHPGGFVGFDLNWQKNTYRMDGTFVEKKALTAPSGISPYALACDDEGNFVLLGWGRAMEGGPIIGFFQAHDRLVLVGDDGKIEVDFGDRLVSERIGTAGGSGPHPAGRATRFAIHDGRLYVGSGERFEVEVWRLDGAMEGLIRGPRVPLEATDSVREMYLETRLASVDDPSRRASLRTSISEWEWPESLPAFTDLRVDDTGVVWLKRWAIEGADPETWSLLHPERAYIGDLRLPPSQRLLAIGHDDLIVLTTDELGVERVARLALDRGGAD